MTALLLHGIAAGLVVALACGDSGKNSATAQKPEVRATRQARAPTDACTLLTQPEAEAILGKPIAPPAKQPSGACTYTAQAGSGEIMMHVLPMGFASKEEFHAFLVKDTEKMNARIKEGMKKMGATAPETLVEPVPEVGAAAYYADPSLLVLKGGQVLNIIAADRRQAVAVAAKALPRFE